MSVGFWYLGLFFFRIANVSIALSFFSARYRAASDMLSSRPWPSVDTAAESTCLLLGQSVQGVTAVAQEHCR